MRIAYLAVGFNMNARLGVASKIADQMAAWEGAGHEARLFVQSHEVPAPEAVARTALRDRISATVDQRIRGGRPVLGLWHRFRSVATAARRVRDWRPDIVFLRYNTYFPALAALATSVPMVLEINTHDLREYRRMLSPGRFLYHRLTRGALLGRACGFVFVTGELAGARAFTRYRKPGLVVANGIDLSAYPVLPAPAEGEPRLAFMGSPGCPWHGVDKMLALARRLPQCRFDLIGPRPDDLGGSIPENVDAHGYLSRAQYEPILARADAAIGTLALHRNGMNEASPLKVREYLAYGLPTIIGYRDTDLSTSNEFVLELPNTADNAAGQAGRIRGFVGRMRGRRVPREAITHLDHGVKEGERLAFFRALVRNRRTGVVAGGAAR